MLTIVLLSEFLLKYQHSIPHRRGRDVPWKTMDFHHLTLILIYGVTHRITTMCYYVS